MFLSIIQHKGTFHKGPNASPPQTGPPLITEERTHTCWSRSGCPRPLVRIEQNTITACYRMLCRIGTVNLAKPPTHQIVLVRIEDRDPHDNAGVSQKLLRLVSGENTCHQRFSQLPYRRTALGRVRAVPQRQAAAVPRPPILAIVWSCPAQW